jgi:hypothetical protein
MRVPKWPDYKPLEQEPTKATGTEERSYRSSQEAMANVKSAQFQRFKRGPLGTLVSCLTSNAGG